MKIYIPENYPLCKYTVTYIHVCTYILQDCAFIMAVRDGDGDLVRKQLEKGVDVNQEVKVHMLMYVCMYVWYE